MNSSFSSRKKAEYIPYQIKEITEACFNVKISGEVFEVENRTLKSGRDIQTIYVADEEDAIVLKRFESKALTKRNHGRDQGRRYDQCLWKGLI